MKKILTVVIAMFVLTSSFLASNKLSTTSTPALEKWNSEHVGTELQEIDGSLFDKNGNVVSMEL